MWFRIYFEYIYHNVKFSGEGHQINPIRKKKITLQTLKHICFTFYWHNNSTIILLLTYLVKSMYNIDCQLQFLLVWQQIYGFWKTFKIFNFQISIMTIFAIRKVKVVYIWTIILRQTNNELYLPRYLRECVTIVYLHFQIFWRAKINIDVRLYLDFIHVWNRKIVNINYVY